MSCKICNSSHEPEQDQTANYEFRVSSWLSFSDRLVVVSRHMWLPYHIIMKGNRNIQVERKYTMRNKLRKIYFNFLFMGILFHIFISSLVVKMSLSVEILHICCTLLSSSMIYNYNVTLTGNILANLPCSPERTRPGRQSSDNSSGSREDTPVLMSRGSIQEAAGQPAV